jgi:TolB-like protein
MSLLLKMKLNQLISELKRRNIIKAIIAYLAVAWVIIEMASILIEAFGAPEDTLKWLIYVFSFGLVVWIIFLWLYDLSPQGFKKTEDIDNVEDSSELTNRKYNLVIVTSLVIAVVLLLGASFWAGSQWEYSESSSAKKIAVIPMTQQSAVDEDGYFENGMTEMLIDELSKVDELTVVNRASVQLLSASISTGDSYVLDVIKGIDYYVNGKIERQQNKINVLIELKESIDTESIWKKYYTKNISDIRSLWADIAYDLTSRIGIEVKLEDRVLWKDLRKVKPETFELYLKGKHFMNKSSPADLQRGLVYMLEALDQSPSDPYANAYLAEAYITLGHGPDPPPDVYPKALAAAQRAIQLDSTIAMGWAALAHYHTYFGMDWTLAEYAFERANELNPNLGNNHYHKAWYLTLFGQMNAAIEEHKKAQELDPFTLDNTAHLGFLYNFVGLYEEGLKECEKVAYMEDEYVWGSFIKGRIFIDQGRVDEGLEILRKVAEINPGLKYWGLGTELILSGHIEEGKVILNELEALPLNGYRALCLGAMYSSLGDNDKAFEYFSYKNKHGWYPWLRVMFVEGEIKKDPRFLKMIRDMNLPDPSPLVYHYE